MDSFLPILIYLKLEVWYNLGTLLKSWSEHYDISSLNVFEIKKIITNVVFDSKNSLHIVYITWMVFRSNLFEAKKIMMQ